MACGDPPPPPMAQYMGTFSLQIGSGWKKNMNKSVKQQLSRINPKVRGVVWGVVWCTIHILFCQDTTHAVNVTVSVNMDGVKVISTDGRVSRAHIPHTNIPLSLSLLQLVMAHALHRILLSTAEAKKCLFAMVARNPQTNPQEGVYCHIFLLFTKEEVGDMSLTVALISLPLSPPPLHRPMSSAN